MAPLLLLVGGNVLCSAGLVAHAFLFNFYLRELGLSPIVMGHQVAAMTLGGLCSLLPTGLSIDRVGLRLTLLVGVAVTTVGLILTALAHSPTAIYAAALVMGFGGATCRVSWGPAIMHLADRGGRERAFSWNTAILIACASLWTVLAGVAPARLGALGWWGLSGFQLALIAGALLTALSAVCYAAIEFPGARAMARQRTASAPLSVGRSLSLSSDLRAIVAMVGLWMLSMAVILPFFNVYFADRFGMPVARVGSVFAFAHLASAVVLIGAAELARRWGPRVMLVVWMLVLPPTFLWLSVTTVASVAVGLFFLQGVIGPATNPLIDQLLLERADPERRGVVAAWRNAAAEGSGAVGASLGGRLLDATSFSSLFVVAASLAAVAAGSLGAALRSRRLITQPLGDVSA